MIEQTSPYNFSDDFPEPLTIAEAEERAMALRQDLNKIRQQLNDSDRRAKMGWSEDDYSRWRFKATHARNIKSVQQQKLTHWISEHRAQRAISALQTSDPSVILAEMVDIITELRQRHHLPLSPTQQNLLSLAENVVNNTAVK